VFGAGAAVSTAFEVGDATRQRLARLGQQVHRGRAQQQEAPVGPPTGGAPGLVDQAAKHRKKPRCAVHLVEDDELVCMVGQVQLGVGHLGAIGLRFQVQVQRIAPPT
jgi:hypothetical protein